MKITRMVFIFLKEQLRTPVSVSWSVIYPVVLFFLMHFDDIGSNSGNKEWLVNQVGWFTGYISLSVMLFSFCLYLVGRRESGFVATFIYSWKSKILFIISQMLASLFMLLIYNTLFLLIVFFGYHVSIGSEFFMTVFYSFILSVFFILCFTWLACVPVTFPTANVIFSVLLMFFMILGIIALKTLMPLVSLLNVINPILIYLRVVSEKSFSFINAGFSCFYLVMLILSIFSVSRFRTEPVWSAQ